MKQFAMMLGNQYLTLNPVTWEYQLSDRLEDLQIWDYHNDLECMPLPQLDGVSPDASKSVRYVELSAEQLALIDQTESEPYALNAELTPDRRAA